MIDEGDGITTSCFAWARTGVRCSPPPGSSGVDELHLAMVPLLGATVLTYGLIASPQTVLHNVQSMATAMPTSACLCLRIALSVELALTSGCFISAMADAFTTKSFTESL